MRLRPFGQHLDVLGRAGGGHADHRAGGHGFQEPVVVEHHRGGLVVVADGDDDKPAGLSDLRRGFDHLGAERAGGFLRLGVDVLGGDRVAVPYEMPDHRLAHPSGADDADAFLVRHDARSRCRGGMLGRCRGMTTA